MKKLIIASFAALSLAAPVLAQDVVVGVENNEDADAGAVVGGTAGGATGAVVGGLIFGPIGAVIGGFAGASLGAEAGVEATSVDYVRLHPTEPVIVEGNIDAGYVVPETVTLHAIDNDPTYGYFYTQDRAYFVDLSNRTVVYSPGTVVAAQ
jgi:hypothetical protein